jgi:hypothetical protein
MDAVREHLASSASTIGAIPSSSTGQTPDMLAETEREWPVDAREKRKDRLLEAPEALLTHMQTVA